MKLLLNNTEVAIIDLGEVKIGEAQTYEYTLENDSGWDVKEIELSLEDIKGIPVKEINFKVKPTKMDAHATVTGQGGDATNNWVSLNVRFNEAVVLKAEDEDKMTLSINDDLSSLLYLRVGAGAKVENR